MKKGNLANGCISKFIKVYVPDESKADLEIPISLNRFLSLSLPRSVTVRSVYGSVYGKIWTMMLKKCVGKLVLVNGWKKIVKEEFLKDGDLLVFEFDGSSCFDFCIYDHNSTCKRLIRPSVKREEDDDVESLVGDEEGDDVDESLDVDVESLDVDGADDFDVDVDDVEDDDFESLDADYEEDVDVESLDVDDNDGRRYLDDPKNAYFCVTLNPKKKSQLHIPSPIIKDYALSFCESIALVDPLATTFQALERKLRIQNNGSVFVKGFGSIIRRNGVKKTDKMICEMKKEGNNNLVHTIKIHILKG